MYIAMNRFRVAKGSEDRFEEIWKTRDRHLDDLPGFIDFKLLKGPGNEEYTLYSSHTVWTSMDAFTDWTKSEHFRNAHRDAGDSKGLYLGHPEFEGFIVVEGA